MNYPEALRMTHAERQARIAELKKNNAAVLATPLPSEGSISPAQIGMMSNKKRNAYSNNVIKKIELQDEMYLLGLSDEELKKRHTEEEERAAYRKAQDTVHQLCRRIDDMEHYISTGFRPRVAKREKEKAEKELREIVAEYKIPMGERL